MNRKFSPGSEWLYLKIYTGIKTSDIILEEVLKPLIEYFQENNIIKKWFFIRYSDPKNHLRIRFELKDQQDYTIVFEAISKTLKLYVDSGEISNIVLDIYNREVERYGKNTMKDAEILFHKNSKFTLNCLHFDDEEKLLVSLFYIDGILNKLNLTIQEKLNWIMKFNDTFKQEFNVDKNLNSQLDKKYRKFNPKFLDFLYSDEFSEERNLIISNIEESNSALQNVIQCKEIKSLEISFDSFFQSIFHMNINRIFVSNQRLFEMVIYDFLLRFYKNKLFARK